MGLKVVGGAHQLNTMRSINSSHSTDKFICTESDLVNVSLMKLDVGKRVSAVAIMDLP